MKNNNKKFILKLDSSLINDLGAQLYRNFETVLAEIISNAWDAGATEIKINPNNSDRDLLIMDNGIGMSEETFITKFLWVGLKQPEKETFKREERIKIGRKGIGKLSFLSWAEEVFFISKTKNSTDHIIGFKCNYKKIVEACKKNEEYNFEPLDDELINKLKKDNKLNYGTLIILKNVKIPLPSPEKVRKLLALSFSFPPEKIKIFFNDVPVNGNERLDFLFKKTQSLWVINPKNKYMNEVFDKYKKIKKFNLNLKGDKTITGWIASTNFPADLRLMKDERTSQATIDIFVTDRVRQKKLLKEKSFNRISERYLYGQINLEKLENQEDAFTSSREEIVASNETYQKFLIIFESEILPQIDKEWRIRRKELNKNKPKKTIDKQKFYKSVTEEMLERIKNIWPFLVENVELTSAILENAEKNVDSYHSCFVLENILRHYLKKIDGLSVEKLSICARKEYNRYKGTFDEIVSNESLNLYSYLGAKKLLCTLGLNNDEAYEDYKKIRNAIAHTALLNDKSKIKLTKSTDQILSEIKNQKSKTKNLNFCKDCEKIKNKKSFIK